MEARSFDTIWEEKCASDAIDLLHAMYLPYCDLWRGDRAFSAMLIKNRVNFHERVVPTLLELPGRIEAGIAQRLASAVANPSE